MKKRIFFLFFIIIFTFSLSGCLYSESGQRDSQVILDRSLLGKEAVSAAWLAYGLKRALWREIFFKNFPNEKNYRYTFQEELEARSSLVKVWIELCETDSTLKDKYLDELSLVYKKGFLKEYVFFYFNRPEWKVNKKLRRDDFMEWAKENIPEHKPVTLAAILPAAK